MLPDRRSGALIAIQAYHETAGLLPEIIVLSAAACRFLEADRPDDTARVTTTNG